MMPTFNGYTKKRPQGRPITKGWGDSPVMLHLDPELAEALEAYAPNPENKTRVIRALIAIALWHVAK